LIGIYKNNVNTSQLSLLLTNLSKDHDGNGNVYTSFRMMNEVGDTILNSNAVYALPNRSDDTIVYNIPVPAKYRHIYNLPKYNCGQLFTEFPDCKIDFCFDTLPFLQAPHSMVKDCRDFEITGIHPTAHGGDKNYSVLITNTYKDSIRNWPISYTSLQLFDENDHPLTDKTSPSYSVPGYKDTIIVHFNFYKKLKSGRIKLQMMFPDCEISYKVQKTTSIQKYGEEPMIYVYPNPSGSALKVNSNETILGVCCYRMGGERRCFDQGGEIDLSSMSPGVYVVEVELINSKVRRRIVKY